MSSIAQSKVLSNIKRFFGGSGSSGSGPSAAPGLLYGATSSAGASTGQDASEGESMPSIGLSAERSKPGEYNKYLRGIVPSEPVPLSEERRAKKFHNKKRPAFKRLESLYKLSTYAPESQMSELIEENRECVFDLLNKSLQHFIAIAMKGRTVSKGDVEKVIEVFRLLLRHCREDVVEGWEEDSIIRYMKRLVLCAHTHTVRVGGARLILEYIDARLGPQSSDARNSAHISAASSSSTASSARKSRRHHVVLGSKLSSSADADARSRKLWGLLYELVDFYPYFFSTGIAAAGASDSETGAETSRASPSSSWDVTPSVRASQGEPRA